MVKKVGYIVIPLLIVLVLFQVFSGSEKDQKDHNKDPSNSVQSPNEEEEDPSTNNDSSPETLVNQIFSQSKKGKVWHSPFVTGQNKIQNVKQKWGQPEATDTASKGDYAKYPDHNVTIGYQDDLIVDIRSYHSELQNIHLKDIKQIKGKPDNIRYYKDNTHNQTILIYNINQRYHLKWILPKPSDQEPNPKVHHISVSFDLTNKGDDQEAVSDILSDMSLNEKIGQMIIAGISGTTLNAHTKDLMNTYQVGGLIFYANNLETPQQTIQLLNQIKSKNAQKRLPLLLGVDQEGGRISRLPGDITDLPTNKKIGSINQSQFSYKVGTLLGQELKAFGFNLDFAPVLDVNSNPNNPVIGDRSFGNNPDIVSKLGIQTMKGIQSQNIVPVVKHFPGHGDTSVDSHLQLPKVNKSLKELKRLELIPFTRAVENGADAVMAAHILLPKIDDEYPASMSKKILTGILRKQLNFDGVVMTDDMTMKAITNNFGIGEAAVKSVKAGSDMILVAHDYQKIVSTIDALKAAVQKGTITEKRINTSVKRIIQLKRTYDLNHEKTQNVHVNSLNQSVKQVLNKYVD
ncbi:beta-N-acetylhexosaminidase [Tuberibacillus sp. Marseille-P3662]|uniref:beta-N-acetylhexosaminidase n=1 Tax=Tuberibacillus sp. Marseille-P3662 TaxID=1965358 RepID=UPI000A1CDD15|nr:beta-N-acetylhexosaminidase [Tuberibacillus sp. Marseille-P3662]